MTAKIALYDDLPDLTTFDGENLEAHHPILNNLIDFISAAELRGWKLAQVSRTNEGGPTTFVARMTRPATS